MPPDLTAATGMDALCHAFEAYVSTASSLLTDMTAIEAIRLISGNLEGACRHPKDMVFRDHMMAASMMAGLAFSNASLGLVHAMAHSLGGAMDLAHGECNAILLDQVVGFNYPAAAEKYARLAQAMGVTTDREDDGAGATLLVGRIASFRQGLGFTQRLSDLGVRESDLSRLAQHAYNDPCLSTNPRQAREPDCRY